MPTKSTDEKKPTHGGPGVLRQKLAQRLIFNRWLWTLTAWLARPHQWVRGARMAAIFSDGQPHIPNPVDASADVSERGKVYRMSLREGPPEIIQIAWGRAIQVGAGNQDGQQVPVSSSE